MTKKKASHFISFRKDLLRMVKKKNVISILIFTILFITGILGIQPNQVNAAQDKTAPVITIKPDKTSVTKGNVKLEIKVTDSSALSSVKWQNGSRSTSYFKSYGKTLKLNAKKTVTVTVYKNGDYTFYAKDKAGNSKVKKVTISNIDKSKPVLSIKKNTENLTNGNIILNFSITDEGFGIKSFKYLTGTKEARDVAKAGKSLKLTKLNGKNGSKFTYTSKLTVKTNQTFTFLTEDRAGNLTLKTYTVNTIDKTPPVISYSLNTTKPTNKSITVKLKVMDTGSGIRNVSYLAGEKTISDFNSGDMPAVIILDGNNEGNFTVLQNGKYTVLVTDNVGNQTLKVISITNMDFTKPVLSLKYSVMNQKATITYNTKDTGSGIASVKYISGKVTDTASDNWSKAKDITGSQSFQVSSAGNYSVMTTDLAGNKIIQVINVTLEFKAVWISYLEYLGINQSGYDEANFQAKIDAMFDNVVKLKMNAVIVQVRPFGDAMYQSSYFPWSRYASGTQGVNPGYDPLEYMVQAAHKRGLEIHAWLNPYRVTTASTDYSKLSKDNPARVWHDDSDKANDRNVLSYNGNLYYNPASKEVQTLITNGVKEIVKKYDVDGIHFDDYFYPSLGSNYANNFDAEEYKTYKSECEKNKKTPLSIANWRRNNVNTLVKNIHKSVKAIDSSVVFGISPGGFIDSLSSDLGYYVDYKTWLSKDGYIDYICPQIYWSFSHSTYPFDKTLNKWLSYRTSSSVKMYVGIATYRAGSSLESDWKNDPDVLKNQVEYGRDTGLVDGFLFFRYDFFYNKTTKPGVDRLLKIL